MFYKRCTGSILLRKSEEDPEWVQWTHHNEGKTHCEECLRLDGVGLKSIIHLLGRITRFVIARLIRSTMQWLLLTQQRLATTASLFLTCLIQMVDIHITRKSSLRNGDIPPKILSG